MDSSRVTAVLLPDGRWHDVDPGTYRSFGRLALDGGETAPERFLFREDGDLVDGPLSSVLATRARGAQP